MWTFLAHLLVALQLAILLAGATSNIPAGLGIPLAF